jgi:hypothetical protein
MSFVQDERASADGDDSGNGAADSVTAASHLWDEKRNPRTPSGAGHVLLHTVTRRDEV